jgi:hypothetical protein
MFIKNFHSQMDLQSYEFQVPASYVLPDFYTHATPQKVAEALTIGASLYDTVMSATVSAEINAIQEKTAAEIARIRASAETRISEMNAAMLAAEEETRKRTNALLEAQRAAAVAARKEGEESAATAYTSRIRALESELATIQENNKALAERRNFLEASRDTDIMRAEERTRAALALALEEKERAVQRAEKSLSTLHDLYEKQNAEIRELGDMLRRKTTNVKAKGDLYEAIFREKLLAAYGTGDKFSLSDTHSNGVGHAGDFLMTWGDHTVLWEVKNYDRPVPSAEVTKFHRDMKENSHVRIGVMVSRYTGITGHTARGDRDIEFFEGKMLIYLSNFEAMSDDTLPFLLMLFRLWWDSDKNIETGEIMESTIRNIERLHAAAVKARTEWRLHKTRMEEGLRWMAELVEENETRLKAALSVLQGGGAVCAAPAHIFRAVDGDEKAVELVKLIMNHVVVKKEGHCILNDLADIVAQTYGFSRDTARGHVRGVLLESVIEPPKGKTPTRVAGLVLKSDCVSHD